MEKWWMRNVRERVGEVSDIKFFLALVAAFCFAAVVPRLAQTSALCSVRYSRDACLHHLGGRAQSCAWCPDALDGERCFNLLPCHNRTRPGCRVQWEGDGSVCAADGAESGDGAADGAADVTVLRVLTVSEHLFDVFAPVMTMLGATFIVALLTQDLRFHFYYCFVTFFGMLILFALWSQGLIPFSTNSPYSAQVTGAAAVLFLLLSPFVLDTLAQGIGRFLSQRAFVRLLQLAAACTELAFVFTAIPQRAIVQLVLVTGWFFSVNFYLVDIARPAQTPLTIVVLWALALTSGSCWWWYAALVDVPAAVSSACVLAATLPSMIARVLATRAGAAPRPLAAKKQE